MEYNQPSELIKELNFGDVAKSKIIAGVDKLAKAVKSTLGASGKCVIYEDARGNPVITKDGVTVAESVVLYDPVENLGATLIKEAAKNTVKEAGDGTTTATVLAEALIKEVQKEQYAELSTRFIKQGINSALDKVNTYLTDTAIDVEGSMLKDVSSISCNNDAELGVIIAEAYTKVGKDGVVFMETSETDETYVDIVDGVQFDCGITSPHFVTDTEKHEAILEEPLVLIVGSEVPNIRKIQPILEHVIKNNIPLLIVGDVDAKVAAALAMNKNKGAIKVNIVPAPTHGVNRKEIFDDLALLTGATVISENLGDDLDLIDLSHLGTCVKAISTFRDTVFQIDEEQSEEVKAIIKNIKEQLLTELNSGKVIKLEKRLAMLSAKLAIVKVGGDSDVELNEKKDRVEDAICATKAAIKEGVVAGGGVALVNASESIKAKTQAEEVVLKALYLPCKTIMKNAGLEYNSIDKKDWGVNVETGKTVNMFKAGIIDPVLVTKSALKNAASVASTILSTNCVMSNLRE